MYLARGGHFEAAAARGLSALGFSLGRTGGPGDAGVDLSGVWVLGSPPHLPVVAQCKALDGTAGVSVVREFIGSVVSGTQPPPVLGLVVASTSFTRDAGRLFGRAATPLGLATCDLETGSVSSLALNRAAQKLLDGRVTVSTRLDLHPPGVVVLFDGRPVPPIPDGGGG